MSWWHAFWAFEGAADLWTQVLVVLSSIASGFAGWAICQVTHKQRGIEVDRPVTDILPMPPPPIVVPDYVPDDLIESR